MIIIRAGYAIPQAVGTLRITVAIHLDQGCMYGPGLFVSGNQTPLLIFLVFLVFTNFPIPRANLRQTLSLLLLNAYVMRVFSCNAPLVANSARLSAY